MTGVLVLVGTLVVASGVGALLRVRDGRVRTSGVEPADGTLVADLQAVGVEPGETATLLQFSSTFCAPCRATRTLLADVAGAVPGVRHVDLDVADDAVLDLVRRVGVLRTPTTLVLDAAGREVRRASGVPRREQVLAALASAAA